MLRALALTAALAVALTGCTWRWVADHHAAHGHAQGQDRRHQVEDYRREAAVFTRYWRAVGQQRTCRPGNPAACARLIRHEFARRGLDGHAAVRVARCESGLNPRASNGTHHGLFQQAGAYWKGRARTYGMAGRSVYDPVANVRVSAGMVRGSGWSHWSCKP